MFRATLFALLLFSASSLILISCAKPSPPVVEPARPIALDPRLCSPIEDAPAVRGSIVAPVTEAERQAVRDYLTSAAEVMAWGRRGWERATVARSACGV